MQLRGVFYARPGLDEGVAAAVERLDRGWVNVPVVDGAMVEGAAVTPPAPPARP